MAVQSPDPKVRAWLERVFDPDENRDQVLNELENETPELRAMIQRAIALDERSQTGAVESAPTATASPTPASLGVHRFPGYEILEELRPGGMSQVYRARHESDPARANVAIKVVNAFSPEVLERFAKEVTILRNLQHPQIATLFEDGELSDGRPFLVMEFIEGETIGAYARDRATDEIVALVRSLCDPLAYCHQRGIWHRDIKPSNVIVRSDGVPILIDFGIAKAESSLLHVTATMNRAMTFLYAAPEQTAGDCTDATDTYSVGMLLYQLLSGRIAYNATTHREWSNAIQTGSPIPITRALEEAARPPISEQLSRVVDKAIRKEPERRYATALDLANDLESYLAGEQVAAKPDDALYRAKRAARRYKVAVAIASALAIASTVSAVVVTRERNVAIEARHQAEVARHNSDVVIATLNQALHLAEKVPGYLEEIPITEMAEITELTRQQLTGEPAARAQLAITVGVVQRDLANYDEAERVLTEAIPNLRPNLAVVARTELGATLHRDGRFDEGEKHLETALASCLELGLPCPATLNELALVQADKKDGNLELAEATMRRALAASVVAGAPWEEAEAKTNLSIVTGLLRRLDEAMPLAEDALRLRKELLPDDHLMVAEAYNNVGTVAGRSGQYETSEQYLRLGYEIRLKTLGPSHPWVLESLNNLALCLRRLKRLDEAEQALRTVLAEYAEHYPEHRYRLDAKQNLASLLIELEKFEEAETLLEAILQQRIEIGYGRKIGTAQLALGRLRLEQEPTKRMRAHTHLAEADTLLAEAYSETHVRVRETRALHTLANYYRGEATESAVCLAAAELYAGATQNDDRAVNGHKARLTRHGMECQ